MSGISPPENPSSLRLRILDLEARFRRFKVLADKNTYRKTSTGGNNPVGPTGHTTQPFPSHHTSAHPLPLPTGSATVTVAASGKVSEISVRGGNNNPVPYPTPTHLPLQSSSVPRPGCMTSPLPRRPMPLAVGSNGGEMGLGFGGGGKYKKRTPQEWNGKHGCVSAYCNNNRHSDSAEVQRRLEEIMQQTGILKLGDKEYKAQPSDLEDLGELGHGTCGHVVKMQYKSTGQVIAVKQLRKTGNKEENKRNIMDLDIVLRSHECPYIVQCLGCFITDSEVWICMELMATCLDKLYKRLQGPIPEKILGKMAVSIVKALNYLKECHGIMHRDVKPSNMLLDWNGTIKLCDFGISGRLVDSKAKTRTAGCAAYMAPERIDPPDPNRPDYDIRADVWSLGISLVELAKGRFPYENCSTDFEVLARILEDDPPLVTPNMGYSTNFCSFVRDCLTKDYKKRPKYKKLLEHPFIREYEEAEVDVASWFREAMHSSPDANSNFKQITRL